MFFLAAILFTAILYASVGHGGASGYLAVMALFSLEPEVMRASALTLNLFVSAIAFYIYFRGGYFRLKLIIPFIVFSVPMAFLGAGIHVEPRIYKIILGVFLIFAVARMVYKPDFKRSTKKINWLLALIMGGFLGFFSGLIGIGGGIILSPLILLFGWASIKETAAVSALFIFLNSLSGLTGIYSGSIHVAGEIYWMVLMGIMGGVLGAYLGQKKVSAKYLTYLLSLVLFLAGFKLIFIP